MLNFIKGMFADAGIGENQQQNIILSANHLKTRAEISHSIHPSNEFVHVHNGLVDLIIKLGEKEQLNETEASAYLEVIEKIRAHQEALEKFFNLKTEVDEEINRRIR